ncbi:unnamed protein product [Brassica rapa subsp. trilocularis]
MAQIISTFYELLKNYREASEEPKVADFPIATDTKAPA